MDFENQKTPIFEGVASNHFTRYQKVLWACLLGCKKLLNFICLTMKFHNRHHANEHDYGSAPFWFWDSHCNPSNVACVHLMLSWKLGCFGQFQSRKPRVIGPWALSFLLNDAVATYIQRLHSSVLEFQTATSKSFSAWKLTILYSKFSSFVQKSKGAGLIRDQSWSFS